MKLAPSKDIRALLPVEQIITRAEREEQRLRKLSVLVVVAVTGWVFFLVAVLMR